MHAQPCPPRPRRRRCGEIVAELGASPPGAHTVQLMDDLSDEVRGGRSAGTTAPLPSQHHDHPSAMHILPMQYHRQDPTIISCPCSIADNIQR
eukprot:350923-Chlamydomonas_euryale.AAC.3